jgi:drug/metabolite transporter (DMT)-like permease
MFKGVAFALGACLVWGLLFVVPQFMTGFSSIEVALGCYLLYGTISTLIFLRKKAKGKCNHSRVIWLKAVYFSLISTIGYYTFVVLALRYSSPVICTLILGTSPITIAFYGNWLHKETRNRSLILPSLLILVGLMIINIPHLEASESPSGHMLGLVFSFLALLAWSWYVVANFQFLKNHPNVGSSDWSTLVGVTTLFWVIIFATILIFFFGNQLQMEKYYPFNDELKRFLIGSAVLGLLCSWLGAFFWNKANLHLPVALVGQLAVFETIFGVTFVYIVSQNTPTFVESIGIMILLSAIVYGIVKFAKKKPLVVHIASH